MFWYILSFQFYTRIATPKWLVNLLNNLLFIITVEIFFLSCWGSFFFITNISYSINNRQKNSFIFINQFFYHCVLHSFKNWMKGLGCFSYKRSRKNNGTRARRIMKQGKLKSFRKIFWDHSNHCTCLKWTQMRRKKLSKNWGRYVGT